MGAKEKRKIINITLILSAITILIIIIYLKNIPSKETYATEEISLKNQELKISNSQEINLEEIIEKNVQGISSKDELYERQEELEYLTKYRYNNELYEGTTQVSQEGRNGIQTITMKRTYDNNGKLISENQVACVVTKSSINKIIDIGTKIYVPPEEPKQEPSKTTQNQGGNHELSFDMNLNKTSGFTEEQFKKALTDKKDVNKIFENNSQYFYYIEEQYCINGMFVAALGIHESAWGTSKLAKNKYNLFGYGAYDSNPYNGAYTFKSYSESIDLIARVLVKYYINPPGTKIYDGQTAKGTYYNGSTMSAVNKRYATDKNWANGIYSHLKYLYGKLN